MASWVTTLQPTKKISAAFDQEMMFAVPSNGAIAIVPWVNVVQNGSAVFTLKIVGASSLDLDPDVNKVFWNQLQAITITASTVGAYPNPVVAAIANPPKYIRWRVDSGVTVGVTFEILLFCWDGEGAASADIGVSAGRKLQLSRETMRQLGGALDDPMYDPMYALPKPPPPTIYNRTCILGPCPTKACVSTKPWCPNCAPK